MTREPFLFYSQKPVSEVITNGVLVVSREDGCGPGEQEAG